MTEHKCAICLEVLGNELPAVFTPCVHSFCETCINRWLDSKKYEIRIPCPACRRDISSMLGPRNPATLYRDENPDPMVFRSNLFDLLAPIRSAPDINAPRNTSIGRLDLFNVFPVDLARINSVPRVAVPMPTSNIVRTFRNLSDLADEPRPSDADRLLALIQQRRNSVR